jgi:hypothetical protein
LAAVAPGGGTLDEILGLTTGQNCRALLGANQRRGIVFSTLSSVAIVEIVDWLLVARAARERLMAIALRLTIGRILGHLFDRIGLSGRSGVLQATCPTRLCHCRRKFCAIMQNVLPRPFCFDYNRTWLF